MADKKVEFEIKVIGDALERLKQITGQTDELGNAAERAKSKLAGIGRGVIMFNQAMEVAKKAADKMREFTEANRAQQEAEAKLAQVMRNTMGASNDEIASIKELASAQQKLGVIGDEVQLAGAQELGTYLSKADSLKKLMPVMNDMLAQQYGLNASQEQATQIASMMGKVMDGQVGALSRYGYKFDEAQEKLLKYGTEEERVATLAEVIGQSVGGMNEALTNMPEGKLQQVANKMGDIKERVGAIWVQIQTKLLPVMDALIGLANGLIDVVQMGWPVWVAAAIGVLIGVTKIKRELEKTSLAALLTGGSFTTMSAIAKAACRGISTAIMSIPIVGWIAAAITLVIGIFTTLWNKCEGFRGFLTGLWEVIKNIIHNIWNILQPIIAKVFGFIKAYIQTVVNIIKTVFNWVKGVLEKVGSWFKKVFHPIIEWFGGLWDYIKEGFYKVLNWLAKPLNKIIAVWNKITGGSVEAFKFGYEKGANKVKENKGISPAGIPGQGNGVDGPGLGSAANDRAAKGAEAAVTGGTRNTTVNINLGKMVENIVFNGTLGENAQELENKIQEILTRTLMMAAATA
jgi:phage-related protein